MFEYEYRFAEYEYRFAEYEYEYEYGYGYGYGYEYSCTSSPSVLFRVLPWPVFFRGPPPPATGDAGSRHWILPGSLVDRRDLVRLLREWADIR